MQTTQPTIGRALIGIVVSLSLASAGMVFAASGSLEPPGSAVDTSGDPVATTQTQPSWDQVLPTSERFVLVMGGAAVLDKETGLVWEQSPDTTRRTWNSARSHCANRAVGGRKGWILPSVNRLSSLVDPGNTTPALPTGHPFSNVLFSQDTHFYWSASTSAAGSPTDAWVVRFGEGLVLILGKDSTLFVWCVRGDQSADAY